MDTTLTHRLQDARLAAAIALVLAAAGLAFANFAGAGENGGPVEYAVSLAVVGLLCAWLFGRVLPDAADPGRAAWILAGLGVVSGLVFWSGLPFVLGTGAVSAGLRAGRTGPVMIGALVVVAAFAACLLG